MSSKFNPNFEGEDIERLMNAVARVHAKNKQPPNAQDRIVRAPLVHRMVHMNEDEDLEGDSTRPGKDVTEDLSKVFAHLAQTTICLKHMHQELGQVHMDICPENLLLHYGKNGEIVYLLNDFDSQYTRRLKPEMYGKKAIPDETVGSNGISFSDYKHYTYEDMKEHLESVSTS